MITVSLIKSLPSGGMSTRENNIFTSSQSGLAEQYLAERTFARSFFISAILAIIISSLGLLGLSESNALKRTREIGYSQNFWCIINLDIETLAIRDCTSGSNISINWLTVTVNNETMAGQICFPDRINMVDVYISQFSTMVIAVSVIITSWKVAAKKPG